MSTWEVSATTHSTLMLRDGRSLGYAECGDPEGRPVFHFHGHPGSRLEITLAARPAAGLGVRLIGIDRPGIGLSDFKPDRQILDWADDVAELAVALGADLFAVQGVSGGGPYALACAYKIPERLRACAVVAGLGPIDLLDTEGMMAVNRLQFWVARHVPWLLRPGMWLYMGRYGKHRDDEERLEALASKMLQGLPEVQRKGIGDSELAKLYVREMLEAFRQGSSGPAHDAELYVRPWGFRLEDISFDRVYLWHGEADVHVPVSMGRAVAEAIPNCRARFYPHETHLSLAFGRLEEVMRTLVRNPG